MKIFRMTTPNHCLLFLGMHATPQNAYPIVSIIQIIFNTTCPSVQYMNMKKNQGNTLMLVNVLRFLLKKKNIFNSKEEDNNVHCIIIPHPKIR